MPKSAPATSVRNPMLARTLGSDARPDMPIGLPIAGYSGLSMGPAVVRAPAVPTTQPTSTIQTTGRQRLDRR